jgi:hypothetical protein
MNPLLAPSTSEPRGPHQTRPKGGSMRRVQHVALWHEHASHRSVRRACKACEHTWEAT